MTAATGIIFFICDPPSPSSRIAEFTRYGGASLRLKRRSTSLVRERCQDPRPGADALVEALEIELLVRRVHPVVIERKTDHQGVHAEHGLEIADDRDRAAGADRDGLFAPLRGKRG